MIPLTPLHRPRRQPGDDLALGDDRQDQHRKRHDQGRRRERPQLSWSNEIML